MAVKSICQSLYVCGLLDPLILSLVDISLVMWCRHDKPSLLSILMYSFRASDTSLLLYHHLKPFEVIDRNAEACSMKKSDGSISSSDTSLTNCESILHCGLPSL